MNCTPSRDVANFAFSKYFQASFDWMKDDERQRIINHVRDIVDNAICSINTNRSDLMTAGYSVSKVINCKIRDAYETHNAPDSDEDPETSDFDN